MTTGVGAVLLAGGRSARMGRPKALLPWGGRTLVEHVAGVLAAGCDGPVVVVTAPGQELPPLAGCRVVADPVEGLGPLQGLATGLTAARSDAEACLVCSTDLPFLVPAYVRAVLALLAPDVDVVLPVLHGHRQPLAAAYRTAVAPVASALVVEGRRRPRDLLDAVRTREVDAYDLLRDRALRSADPQLRSVLGVNTPAEWEAALVATPDPGSG